MLASKGDAICHDSTDDIQHFMLGYTSFAMDTKNEKKAMKSYLNGCSYQIINGHVLTSS
jgi:hypothetical protein